MNAERTKLHEPRPGRAKSGSHAQPDAEYAELLAAQGGGCAICGARPKTRRLHTDREHRTGQVRGLLCMRCNRALPTWVNPAWLHDAADYLRLAACGYPPGALRAAREARDA